MVGIAPGHVTQDSIFNFQVSKNPAPGNRGQKSQRYGNCNCIIGLFIGRFRGPVYGIRICRDSCGQPEKAVFGIVRLHVQPGIDGGRDRV